MRWKRYGFYCVDNLPVVLLPDLARTLADRQISAAVSIDVPQHAGPGDFRAGNEQSA